MEQFRLSDTDDQTEDDDDLSNDLDFHMKQRALNFDTTINVIKENDSKYVIDPKPIDFENIDYSKDNYILTPQGNKSTVLWTTQKPESLKKLKKDKIQPGLTSYSRDANTFLKSFKLFISDDITSIILLHTNQSLQLYRAKKNKKEDYEYKDITKSELLAYYGLMIAMGLNKDNKKPLHDLWKYDDLMTGSIYNLVISRDRFVVIHKFIRFDDESTTNDRRKNDKLAKVSEIIDLFNENCINAMNIGESVTVDEQLLKLFSRFGFRQYIPDKPAKYGIKRKLFENLFLLFYNIFICISQFGFSLIAKLIIAKSWRFILVKTRTVNVKQM